MDKTYTYTARSADNPERVVTFTLRGSRMSVGVGTPLEQVEKALQIGGGEELEPEEELEEEAAVVSEEEHKLWLKPLAVSLMERGTRPLHVDDVDAKAADDWLQVRAWVRTGGLRLFPITLIDGRIDNPDAAQAFAEEIAERQVGLKLFGLLDYWATWIVGGLLLFILFQQWRQESDEAE
jgi:hypothetical protein